jgi:thioredoxin reductase
MIYMSRAFFADFEYLKKIKAGKGEDVVPCLLCNKCHCRPGDPEFGCAVNPQLALSMDPNFAKHIDPAPASRKVAVIGGGPAGMEAALIAAGRGHQVTLYEKTGRLGGQLELADHADFKWPVKLFREYLEKQVEKSNVRVLMNTEAMPERLAAEGYSAILYAAGSVDRAPAIPGIETTDYWQPRAVYGHAEELGQRVVVIGGSDTGCETAWYLALAGKKVVQVSRTFPEGFFKDADRYEERLRASGSGGSLKKLARTKTLQIAEGKVTVSNKKLGTYDIACDSIVACGGAAPVRENIMEFAALCDEFRVIGDSHNPRDIRVAMKDAYTAAIML